MEPCVFYSCPGSVSGLPSHKILITGATEFLLLCIHKIKHQGHICAYFISFFCWKIKSYRHGLWGTIQPQQCQNPKSYHSYLTSVHFISVPVVMLQFIHCLTVYFNNLHAYSHQAEIGSAQAYLKVQCNPVICRVVRKIHSPLTPIGVLSLLMQLIVIRCYLHNTEQFTTLTPPHARTHAHVPENLKSTPWPPSLLAHARTHTFAHSCDGQREYSNAHTLTQPLRLSPDQSNAHANGFLLLLAYPLTHDLPKQKHRSDKCRQGFIFLCLMIKKHNLMILGETRREEEMRMEETTRWGVKQKCEKRGEQALESIRAYPDEKIRDLDVDLVWLSLFVLSAVAAVVYWSLCHNFIWQKVCGWESVWIVSPALSISRMQRCEEIQLTSEYPGLGLVCQLSLPSSAVFLLWLVPWKLT